MAGRKGFMSGSPFHIETTRYKYAVERSDVIPDVNKITCKWKNEGICTNNAEFLKQPCKYYKCNTYKSKDNIEKEFEKLHFYNVFKKLHPFLKIDIIDIFIFIDTKENICYKCSNMLVKKECLAVLYKKEKKKPKIIFDGINILTPYCQKCNTYYINGNIIKDVKSQTNLFMYCIYKNNLSHQKK